MFNQDDEGFEDEYVEWLESELEELEKYNEILRNYNQSCLDKLSKKEGRVNEKR